MTFLDRFCIDHPEMREYARKSGLLVCPSDCGYEPDTGPCDSNARGMSCKQCWLREIPPQDDRGRADR